MQQEVKNYNDMGRRLFSNSTWDIVENKRQGHVTLPFLKVTQHAVQWSIESKYSKLKKTKEKHLVRPAEVCG